jgi:hypothetical protein
MSYNDIQETIFEDPINSERKHFKADYNTRRVINSPHRLITDYDTKASTLTQKEHEHVKNTQLIHNTKTKTVVQKHLEDPVNEVTGKGDLTSNIGSIQINNLTCIG